MGVVAHLRQLIFCVHVWKHEQKNPFLFLLLTFIYIMRQKQRVYF